MRNVILCAFAVALMLGGTAFAQGKVWDDLSWWGKSGATPEPVKDSVRSGYWWWPTEPKSNVDDQELWGNRGKVYHIFTPEIQAPPPPPPPETPKPPVARTKPVFDNVLFDFDKAVLKPEGKAVADKVIAELKAHPNDTILLEGHTDPVGSEEYNMGLGQRRADAVKKYMVEQGIAENRVTTKSFGEGQPVPNVPDTPEGHKLQRRVVFQYSLKD